MMKRKILKVFLWCICYAVFFYSTTAFGIDWEQWRILRDGQDNSSGVERPAPRQEREDTRKREAFKLNEKGNQAYRAGNWKEAINYYQKALRKSPHDTVIKQNLTNARNLLAGKKGNQAYRAGNWKEAISYYEKALKMSPNNRVLKQNLINAQNALARDYTRKKEEYARRKKEQARKRKEDTRKREAFKLNKKRGNQAYRAGNWKEAITYYEKALRRFPDDRAIRKKLTNAQNANAKENTKKEGAFELNKKGIQAYRAGNWQEAIAYYEKALRKFPNDMLIRQNLTNAKNALNKAQISGNVQAANQGDAIKDLRNSAYWALTANAVSENNYEAVREYGEFSARTNGEGEAGVPSVPDVPAPVPANPQARVYALLIKEANRTTSELKLIDTNLEQAKEKKRKSEEKIDLQIIMIEELKQKTGELKQKKSEFEKKDKQEGVDGLGAEVQALQKEQEEIDALIAAALAAQDEAEEEVKEASKNLVSLNERKKDQEGNMAKLKQKFDTVNKHSEQAGEILKELEGGK